ncbi:hypothetical protein GCM10023231_38880 [Olivibacter ginsenosidimutans]|uniref:DUF3160 domain-containing protein n=2 Tax=Olivibacter ginsenosidimutans TaxID=1176537 RepID=A0ABP9C9K8_9SPHI
MTIHSFVKTAFITLLFCLGIIKGYTQQNDQRRTALKQEIAAFMLSTADEVIKFRSIADTMQTSTTEERRKALQKTPLFITLKGFLDAHAEDYLSVREQELAKFAMPPKALANLPYKPIPMDSTLESFYNMPEIASLILIHALSPAEVTLLVNNLLMPQIIDLNGEDGRNQATISQLCGAKTYVKQEHNHVWKIWNVNRLYPISFSWNTETGVMSNFNYLPPDAHVIEGITFTDFMKPATLWDTLFFKLRTFQWNLYHEITSAGNDSYYERTKSIGTALHTFFQKNKSDYLQVRKQLLTDRPAPITVPASAHAIIEDVDSVGIKDELTSLNPFIFGPEDLTMNLYIFLSSGRHLSKEGPITQRVQDNAVIGFQHHAAPTPLEYVWKIQAIGYAEIIEYNWNIATGELSSIKMWEK